MEGCCGRACLWSYDPALVPEAPIGKIDKKGQHQHQRDGQPPFIVFEIVTTPTASSYFVTSLGL